MWPFKPIPHMVFIVTVNTYELDEAMNLASFSVSYSNTSFVTFGPTVYMTVEDLKSESGYS